MCHRLICFVFVLAVICLTLVTADAQTVKVNFQSRTQGSREVPEGYLPDYGDIYGDRGNGFSYGWSVDKQDSSRDRDINPDQRYDTNNSLNIWNTGLGFWEIAIPNGTYNLFIVGGDPGYKDATNSYIVEGVEVLDPTPYPPGDYFDTYEDIIVTVNDGRLTIAPVEGVGYVKICFVHITNVGAAQNPEPADREMVTRRDIVLSWNAGVLASQHDVYFGESFDAVEDATTSTADIYKGRQSENMYPADGTVTVEPGGTYYWRVDEISGNNVSKGDVWTFTVQPLTAYNPEPGDGALFVDPNAVLTWNAGMTAQSHAVYFGDDYDVVTNADTSTSEFMGSQDADNTTWATPYTLILNKMYYWRIDEQESDGTTHRGDIWAFTTTTRDYGGVKGEYYNNMELSGTPAVTRIDPQIDFDWQYDSPDPLITEVDSFSVRWTGQVEIPTAGEWTLWLQVEDTFNFWFNDRLLINDAPGLITWYDATVTVQAGMYPIVLEYFEDGNIALARLAWQGPTVPERQIIPSGALLPPYAVGTPYPPNNSVDVEVSPVLTWTAGDKASQHELYFGTDMETVENATTGSPEHIATLDLGNESYDIGTLEYNSTYYWRIDEVNSVNSDSPWIGQIWNFTTGNYILIDNFENYSDYSPDEVWNTWIDGYSDATNGSTAGYPDPDFNMDGHYLENIIVHSGRWSMPIFYDNSAGLSEVTRTFDSSLRNWTSDDVVTLTLFYHGDAGNSPEPMYIALNGNAVVTNSDTNAALATDWVQWDIALQEFAHKGVNLTNVNSMSIGLGNKSAPVAGGSGHVFIDDIRLYK